MSNRLVAHHTQQGYQNQTPVVRLLTEGMLIQRIRSQKVAGRDFRTRFRLPPPPPTKNNPKLVIIGNSFGFSVYITNFHLKSIHQFSIIHTVITYHFIICFKTKHPPAQRQLGGIDNEISLFIAFSLSYFSPKKFRLPLTREPLNNQLFTLT